ncbi:HlyD family secretion protein [Paramixta manurensis]|uniref:HlyD family secretion protein n=1 Tax=Paramixta manurensis TaxID=2740817 RepID=A0A6M8UCS3_9GAMM|nr:HlyD family secretion protein [Erwiniaceae bacterium PD-1]
MLFAAMSTSSSLPDGMAPPVEAAGNRKKRLLLLFSLALTTLVVLALLYWFFIARFNQSTDDAYLQADSVTMAPKVSGYVREVLVGDNQDVAAGQPLVKLNAEEYQAQVDQARATILANQADIERAEAEIVRQQADIEQAEAQQNSAQIQMQYAQREYQRYLPLAKSGVVSKENLSDQVRSRDRAQADYAANVAAVKSATAQIRSMKAEIAQAKAQLASAQASLQQASINLQDTLIRSPVAGRVGDRSVRVGQYVQPGTRLLTVVPVQDVYLVANFKETQMGDIRIGQPATLHVDALPDHDFRGEIESFAPGTGSQFALLPPENATGNFTKIVQRVPVRIRITDNSAQRQRLLPGMSVTVDIDTHPLKQDR